MLLGNYSIGKARKPSYGCNEIYRILIDLLLISNINFH